MSDVIIDMSAQVKALAVLVVYSVFVLLVGYYISNGAHAEAIVYYKSLQDMVKFQQHFPAPEPGYETCSQDKIPGTTDFFVKVCRITPQVEHAINVK